jgi:hypothetical protein
MGPWPVAAGGPGAYPAAHLSASTLAASAVFCRSLRATWTAGRSLEGSAARSPEPAGQRWLPRSLRATVNTCQKPAGRRGAG